MNTIAEPLEFDIALRYAIILNTLFSTAFYAPILPVTLVWGLIAVLLHYWSDKYALLRRKVVKYSMSSDLSTEMTEHLEYFLPIYSVIINILMAYLNIFKVFRGYFLLFLKKPNSSTGLPCWCLYRSYSLFLTDVTII